MNDITYGKNAETWPRDYSMISRRLQYLRFNKIPVRVISGNGTSVTGYIAKFYSFNNMMELTFSLYDKLRWPIMIESIALLEENVSAITETEDGNRSYIEQFNELNGVKPSKKDFFSICNKCFKQGVGVRIFLQNGYTVEGRTTGVNDCHVGIINCKGNHVQVMFDWVLRITSIDFIET